MNTSFYIFDIENGEEYIRKSGLEKYGRYTYYTPTTSFSDMQERFKMHRELFTMEQIKKTYRRRICYRSVQ